MVDPRLISLSKLMSLMLRHEPDKFGLVLDGEGFTPIAELLSVLQKEAVGVTESDVRAVVATVEPKKQRFSIDEGDIRANYGHSLGTKIRQEPATPPELLLHGTTESVLPLILSKGLLPMKRQYVHLTVDSALALKIGQRRGKPRLVRVAAMAAHADGIPFYKANASFWLADKVPAKYLSVSS